MKRNKIAAGALALALGLGAVAPSFAADTKVSAEFTYDYKLAKNDFIEKWNALRAAEKAVETAKANEEVAKKAYEDALAKLAVLEARYGKTPGKYADTPYQEDLDRAMNEKAAAVAKYEANAGSFSNKPNYDVLTAKYDAAKEKLVKEGVSVDVINRAEKAGDITLIFENVKPAKPADKDEIKPETRAALEKAILDAKIQIKAVETLKKTTPKTIAKVVDKLDKLVKDAEATIKVSEELLGKKAALNLVSTAYAAEEEKSAEEKAKELTEKLNEKTKEIEDTLKENEKNQPAEEEVKPEDDKKDEKKPADDKKDEEKPAED